MDVTAESIVDLWDKRDRICGLEFTCEPKHLRCFRARFKPTVGAEILRDQGSPTPGAQASATF